MGPLPQELIDLENRRKEVVLAAVAQLKASLGAEQFTLFDGAVRRSVGQDVGAASAWDYDEENGELYAMAETWANYTTAYYYETAVTLDVGVTPLGGQLYWTCGVGDVEPNSSAWVDCTTSITGSADLILYTEHILSATYNVYEFEPDCYMDCYDWWDAYRSSWLGVDGQEYPADTSWYTYGPPAVAVPETQTMRAGVRKDTTIGCGNQEMDNIIAEYRDPANQQTWVPVCADLMDSGGTLHFEFDELNTSDYPNWGIMRDELPNGLECVRTAGGDVAMPVTSGYRNPAKQMRVNPSAPNSRHTRGDAADIAETNTGRRNNMHDAWGPGCGACVEPLDRTATWVHFDWRGGSCSGGW